MLEHHLFRQPAPGEPLILAVFSYRYDAHLVPGLVENIRPGVHGYVAWDDRQGVAALTSEPARRARLFHAAREAGADWILFVDPDERLENGFARWLPDLIAQGPRILWSVTVCEMFAPGLIRTDGPWGGKSRLSFFPAEAAITDPEALLHAAPIADRVGFRHRGSGINLYHLRMAAPARRQLRRDLYAAADPDRRFQRIGYDYLTDERGMVLEPVPERRGFHPPFVDDDGLWAPDPRRIGSIAPDPYEVRFARAAQSARQRGQLAAYHVLLDLFHDSPEDLDLPRVAARMALEGGAPEAAVALARRVLRDRPGDAAARFLRAEGLVALGEGKAATRDLAALRRLAKDSPVLDDLAASPARPTADFTAPDAVWRALGPADCVIHEGAEVATSDLATVVIGFQGEPGLLGAVQSLVQQDTATEIVVVNSGGGDVLRDLSPVAERIRLVTCQTPLYVGAARNIGVAASRAPFVAFLAGDCRARQGWVTARLARHRAGALSVASAVAVPDGSGLVALAGGLFHYGARHPTVGPREVSLYGISYARGLLQRAGLFPPGQRTGEDTRLNRIAARFARPVWAPEVVTDHPEPGSLRVLLHGDRGRGQRRAAHPPLRAEAAEPDRESFLGAAIAHRGAVASRILDHLSGFSGAERRAIRAMLWLAAQADVAGTLAGLNDIAAAKALADEAAACLVADPGRALGLLVSARALDPQDGDLASAEGAARQALGDLERAEVAYRAALDLVPGDVSAATGLVSLVAGSEGASAALVLAERLALAAPTRAGLWDLAARQALAAGQAGWAVVLGGRALSAAVDKPWAHRQLAELHRAAGDPLASAFRMATARRLAEAAERPAAPGLGTIGASD